MPKIQSGKFNYTGSGASFCTPMTYTEAFVSNSSAPAPTSTSDGQQFTVTNTGGGAGSYVVSGDTKWRSTTGKISYEMLWNSSTDITDGGIGLIISQG